MDETRMSTSNTKQPRTFLLKSPFLAVLMVTALAMGCLSGCSKTSTDTASGATFTQIYAQTLSIGVTCLGCHSPGGAGTDNGATLDFSTQALAYSTLMNSVVAASGSGAACAGVPIVTAGQPSQSYIAAMFISEYRINDFAGAAGCLPINSHEVAGYMSEAEKSALLAWIQNGALNN